MSKIIHPIAVLVLLLIPFMFVGPNEELSIERYLFKISMPMVMIIIFYINYLWLLPRHIDGTSKMNLYSVNLVLIVIGCIVIALSREMEFDVAPPEYLRRHIEHRPSRMPGRGAFHVFAVFRDALNFILAIVVAYSLRMSKHATRLERERQEAEVARRDAELKGLRQQISPHFLLNTLNNIYALTAISSDRAQQAIIQLSQMLRHMLYENQQKMVEFSSECRFISSYVDLMKLRMASNVKVNVDIVIPDNDKSKVAPLLFISLVENAFKHGVSSTEPSTISIRLEATDTEIKCDIANTNFPKTSSDRSGHGIGLQQVEQRLNSVYQESFTWTHGVREDGLYHSEIILKK